MRQLLVSKIPVQLNTIPIPDGKAHSYARAVAVDLVVLVLSVMASCLCDLVKHRDALLGGRLARPPNKGLRMPAE